jgi:hypothetical protein
VRDPPLRWGYCGELGCIEEKLIPTTFFYVKNLSESVFKLSIAAGVFPENAHENYPSFPDFRIRGGADSGKSEILSF